MDVGGATRWDMRPGGLPARDPRGHRAPVRRRSRRSREDGWAPAERFRAAGRHRVRRDRLDHGAVLPHLRPRAGSPPTAPSCSASTASAGSTSASCSAAGASDDGDRRTDRRDLGARAPTAAPRSARRSPTAACCTRSRACAPIPGARCTPAAADGAPRRAHPAADPPEHGQHRPAVRGHRHAASPDRAARLLARRRARSSAPGSTTGTRWTCGSTPTGSRSATRSAGTAASTSRPTRENDYRRGAVPGPSVPGLRQRDRGHAAADPREASRPLLSHSDARRRSAASTSRTR